MHHSPIRALAWSQNAMKLYTGDEDGVVVCTELNYDDVSLYTSLELSSFYALLVTFS